MAVNQHLEIKRIDLYKEYGLKRKKGYAGYLDIYIPAAGEINPINRLHPFMLVIPGGAYAFVSYREGEPVLFHYMTTGFYGAILNYSIKVPYPVSLIESMLALKYIKEHSKALRIRNDKVAAIGFSAGGHLVGLLSTITASEKKLIKGKSYRPDASLFSYSVISGDLAIIQKDSFENIFATTSEAREALSIDKRVDSKTPSSFIWATRDDGCVPYENSVRLHDAMDAAKVDNQLLILDHGQHGLSVCDITVYPEDQITPSMKEDREWLTQSDAWLGERDFKILD